MPDVEVYLVNNEETVELSSITKVSKDQRTGDITFWEDKKISAVFTISSVQGWTVDTGDEDSAGLIVKQEE